MKEENTKTIQVDLTEQQHDQLRPLFLKASNEFDKKKPGMILGQPGPIAGRGRTKSEYTVDFGFVPNEVAVQFIKLMEDYKAKKKIRRDKN